MSLSRKLAKFISNYSDPQSIGSQWRAKRILRLVAMVEEVFAEHGAVEIVDIGGMDTFARGAKIAAAIRKDGVLDEFVKNRYRSFDSGIGQKIESGKATFADCEKYILDKGEYLARGREVGEAYRRVIGKNFPAMTLVVVASLLEDRAKVEIEATAVVPD